MDSYWKWYNSSVVGGQTQYEFILQQLNQTRADKNFVTEVRLVDQEDMLAAYLAMNEGIQVDNLNGGNQEAEEVQENNGIDVVIGLPAVPLEEACELNGEGIQYEPQIASKVSNCSSC